MKVQPIGDRILVKRVEEDTTSKGGIIIPDSAKEKPMTAEVIAIGPGERQKNGERRPMSVSVGDTVLLGKFGGTEVTVDGEDVVLVREDEIYAILG
jgi:chaperonin GroES